jgi:NitT/TauT family transport system substrate-binding protein
VKTRNWTSAIAVVALAASLLSACGGSDKKNAGGLEKTNVTIATLPTVDAATVYLAIKKGYFKAEGLNVKTSIIQNNPDIIQRVLSGNLDFAHVNYVTLFVATANGVKVKIISDAYQGRDKLFPIMALPSSGIKDAKGLQGKKIGIINTKGFPALLTQSALSGAGVPVNSVHYVEIQLPAMGTALKNKSIDAAFMADPYVSQIEQQFGARPVVDTMSGPTADLAVSGYITSPRFAQQNPKTVAAFKRALAKAQADAQDRNEITGVLPTYIMGLTPQTAQTISLGTYPTSLNKTRLQRVADLMTQYGQLKGHYDVQPLLG